VLGVHADEESLAVPDTFRISAMSLEFCFNPLYVLNVYGGVEVELHSFWLAPDEVSGHFHMPRSASAPIGQEVGWKPEPLLHFG